MKPIFNLDVQNGYCFFLIYKLVGEEHWKPIYKSELKPQIKNIFEFNTVIMLTTDIVSDGNIDLEFKMELFRSSKNGKHIFLGQVNISMS